MATWAHSATAQSPNAHRYLQHLHLSSSSTLRRARGAEDRCFCEEAWAWSREFVPWSQPPHASFEIRPLTKGAMQHAPVLLLDCGEVHIRVFFAPLMQTQPFTATTQQLPCRRLHAGTRTLGLASHRTGCMLVLDPTKFRQLQLPYTAVSCVRCWP